MLPQAALPADFGLPALNLKPGAVIVTLHLSGIPKAQRLSKWHSICKKLCGCGIGGPAKGVGRALPLAQPPPPQLLAQPLAQPPPQPCIPTTKVGAW